jgi:hypothetical protein
MITDRQLELAADKLLNDHLSYTEDEGVKEYDPEDESIHCGYCACYLDGMVGGVSPEGWNLCQGCADEG